MTNRGLTLLTCSLLAVMLFGLATADAAERRSRTSPVERSGIVPTEKGGICNTISVVQEPMPWTDGDNNCGAADVMTDYGQCAPSVPYPGPEQTWELTVGPGNDITEVTLTPNASSDLALFLLSACDDGSSCFDASDYYYGGTVEVINPGNLTPGTYFLYVDSYYDSGAISCGDYSMTVTGTLPVELIEFDVE